MKMRRTEQPVPSGKPAAPSGETIDVGSASAVGGRTENQDRCFANRRVAIVSDGMGGYRGGARAAELSVRAVVATLHDRGGHADAAALRSAFERANADVRAGRIADPDRDRMGATLTVALAQPGTGSESRWLLAHVGDSPAYVVTPGGATQVTVDHTAPALLHADGTITAAQASVHPARHVLLRAVGAEPGVEADLTDVTLQVGDALVLGSDGLSGTLTAAEIGRLVNSATSAVVAADTLVATAVERGASDNVTAVVVRHVASSVYAQP